MTEVDKTMSELEQLDRIIIENQSHDGSIDISDQRSMRDEIVAYITANYIPNTEIAKTLDRLETEIIKPSTIDVRGSTVIRAIEAERNKLKERDDE